MHQTLRLHLYLIKINYKKRCSARPGALQEHRARAAVPGLRQTVVERVSGDPGRPQEPLGQDICPGRERHQSPGVLVREAYADRSPY